MSASLYQLCQPGKKVPPVVTTFTGRDVNIVDPQVEDICIEDIAHALANLCRYNGHTTHFYSVAQHCCIMAHSAHEDIALEVLLHDATEAYLGDIATPLKQLLPYYVSLEANMTKVIGEKFLVDLEEPITHANIKALDWRAAATEVRDLMPDHAGDWEVFDGIEPFDFTIHPVTPREAKRMFLSSFEMLS